MKHLQTKPLYRAAALSDMDEKTGRKYRDLGGLPSEMSSERTWRTRSDPFDESWPRVVEQLGLNPNLESKTIFEWMQLNDPGRYQDGQLRTLQRRIKIWRATKGPHQEVYFPQQHLPGRLCQSDFTHMHSLGITLSGQPFEHLLFHLVLTYSNWETGTVCFSESFESLSEGFQNAIWKLGGVPALHQTDSLSAAVNKPENKEEFTSKYQGLMRYCGLEGVRTNPRSPNENGDVEQSHFRFKTAVDQALMLRGSRDFASREAYDTFLRDLISQRNLGRRARFQEELKHLRTLPDRRLESFTKEIVRVGPSSTIRVRHNTYSVESRLVGERVEVRLYAETLEVWYAQKCVERMDRLRGDGGHRINYRHIIGSLIRKPGAFARYRYREDLFPSLRFRMAYDALRQRHTEQKASREYLVILQLAAQESETRVESAIAKLIELQFEITAAAVTSLVNSADPLVSANEPEIDTVDLSCYDDALLEAKEALL